MKEPLLLSLNATIFLIMGLMLLFLPLNLFGILGLPIPEFPFYTSVFGALLIGVGLAFIAENLQERLKFSGLNPGGAILINMSFLIPMILWLAHQGLPLTQEGLIAMWGLSVLLFVISLLELALIIQQRRSDRILEAQTSKLIEEKSPLGRAIAIAAKAHQEQKDRAGLPYILHPIRIMLKMDREEEKIVAALHDVVENTPWTLEQLKREGFSDEVLRLVAYLTRRPDESYEQYIDRLRENRVAIKIKMADLEDNMDLRRLPHLSDNNVDWIKRYHRYWLTLKETQEKSISRGRAR